MGPAQRGHGYLESKRQSDQANRFRSERFASGSSKEGLHLMNYSNTAALARPASRTLAAIANTVSKNFAPKNFASVARFGQIGVLTAAFAMAAGSPFAQQPIAPAPAPAAKPAAPAAPAKKPAAKPAA